MHRPSGYHNPGWLPGQDRYVLADRASSLISPDRRWLAPLWWSIDETIRAIFAIGSAWYSAKSYPLFHIQETSQI